MRETEQRYDAGQEQPVDWTVAKQELRERGKFWHRLLAKRFPFAIYYKLDGDACVVWRVLDCRQNPAKIKDAPKRGP